MNDEAVVQAALNTLAEKRTVMEQSEYDFFFSASIDVQKSYYTYWIKLHSAHDIPMPRFLVDYEKDLKLSQKS